MVSQGSVLLLLSEVLLNLCAMDGMNHEGECRFPFHQDPSSSVQWDGHQRSQIPAPHGNSLPYPDSPNPPSVVTLRSLLAVLSARIFLWQIFTRGCFGGRAVSQSRWQGPTPHRRCWQGHGCKVLISCGASAASIMLLCRRDLVMIPGLQHPNLCC